jgi:hypothetical protein
MTMKVRLVRKLANCLDGIDVTACKEGDWLDLSPADAMLLFAEGWVALEESDAADARRVSRSDDLVRVP